MNIGIGIVDNSSQENFHNCWNSIPTNYIDNCWVVSNTHNKISTKNILRYNKEASIASLYNKILSKFRCNDIDYIFIINTLTNITSETLFEDTIKKAHEFGTWIITGLGKDAIFIEEDEKNISLSLTPELNNNFIFLHKNIIKKLGYFREQYLNQDGLEMLDYVMRARELKLYPPYPFNPCVDHIKINNNIRSRDEKLDKISYGYFQHLHQYIPGYNDPSGVTQDQLFNFMEYMQKNYSKSI
jgi:hypothetical protein